LEFASDLRGGTADEQAVVQSVTGHFVPRGLHAAQQLRVCAHPLAGHEKRGGYTVLPEDFEYPEEGAARLVAVGDFRIERERN